ncbi:Cupin domain protein [Aspergillus sclerotialis]|uniref:Cupin domain protein n=1 Tax=Aspergillus sclerotialis TaxID=2070753 RepID=A0A3A2Z744_9EURO|nr:Cupin domain protein [Aspergillus sclerotialis]
MDLESRVADLTAKLRDYGTVVGHPHPATSNVQSTTPQEGFTTECLSVTNDSGESQEDADDEIRELNQHTNTVESHGRTSSAAFIGHLQRANEPTKPVEPHATDPSNASHSLISTLHNQSFSPPCTAGFAEDIVLHGHGYYFEHAHAFIDGYFENIHFIHPFIDKNDFMSRSHDLWLSRTPRQNPSFVALYLSVLSFGSLVRVWDEERLGGLTRFEWSRKLFGEAQKYLNHLQFSNDLETVQCLYLMWRICTWVWPSGRACPLDLIVKTTA